MQDTRPEEEYRVSHMPGSVRVDPDAEPDLGKLGVTEDTPGMSPVQHSLPLTTLPLYCSGVLLLCGLPLQPGGSEAVQGPQAIQSRPHPQAIAGVQLGGRAVPVGV